MSEKDFLHQCARGALMIQPVSFDFNPQTAATNPFQNPIDIDRKVLEREIYIEFRTAYVRVQHHGVKLLYLPDTKIPPKPDALFSNNWISTHRDGTMVLYPLMATNRRPERRLDVIDRVREQFEIGRVIDLSYLEYEGKFLEGTGSLVFDHVNKFVYACLSPRTHPEAVRIAAEHLKHEPVIFNAFDRNGRAIYHTNMMLSIGPGYAVICVEAITDLRERKLVLDSLTEGGFEIIEINYDQMERFAANIICMGGHWNKDGQMIAMSWTAYDSFTDEQKAKLRKYGVLKRMDIPHIEKYGGGGLRCLITEMFPTVIYRIEKLE